MRATGKASGTGGAGRTWVALLRGINVGGHNRIPMAELKTLHESLGFTDVTTYIQSGNVVCRGPDADAWGLSRKLEEAITGRWGHEVRVVLRTSGDLERVAEGNPFLAEGVRDLSRLYVTFLASVPAPGKLKELRAPEGMGDALHVTDREIYLYCPGGHGRSKLSNDRLERALQVQATTRNWNTVCTLAGMARKLEG